MISLTTRYLGLDLKSPVIVSSSGLTASVEKIRHFEEAGAGAVVLKSLFEEQISFDAGKMVENRVYSEAFDYISGYVKNNAVEEYLRLIEAAKKTVKIPVIASINCMLVNEWVSFAREIEKAGADALELNMFFVPTHPEKSPEKYEERYHELVVRVKKEIKIPLTIKLGNHFTNLVGMVNSLYVRGASGVVLFNRFYEPDLDIEKMEIISSGVFSSPSDMRQTLRWVGLVSDKVKQMDISASTGIHDGKAAIKQILAGAKTVQICSVLYKKGEEQITAINNEITDWMKRKGYKTLDDFRGKLNASHIADPSVYMRAQFMKYFSSYH
jgi:dihydroorotate dehydrogenase (fumarate)